MDILSKVEQKSKKIEQIKSRIKRIELHMYSESISHNDLLLLDNEKTKLQSELDEWARSEKFIDQTDRILDRFDLNIEKIQSIDVQYLIDHFIVKHEVTLVVAKPSSGKSLCSSAIANMVLLSGKINVVVYFDADNGTTTLSERGIPDLKKFHSRKFRYIHDSSASKSEMFQVIKVLESIDLHGYLIIFDSIKNFMPPGGDRNSNKEVSLLLDMPKRLRRHGATVIILHHTNKPQKDFQESTYAGSSAFEEDVSNAVILNYNPHRNAFIFKPFKNRVGNLKEKAFNYLTEKSILVELDLFTAKETAYDEEVRIEIIAYLEGCEAPPNASQIKKHLASECGYTNNDKVHFILQAGKERFWRATKVKEKNNMDLYELLTQTSIDKSDNSDNCLKISTTGEENA